MPEGITPPPPKPEGYGRAAKEALPKLMEERNLPFHPPAEKADTTWAHIGTEIAGKFGKQLEFVKQVFAIRFAESKDISTREAILQAAERAGLPVKEFDGALQDDSWRRAVERNYELAHDLEISTIPSYIGAHGAILVHDFREMPDVGEIRKIL